MITISIAGPRGEGSTTTAAAIVKMLRDAGQSARYVGDSRHQEVEVERLLAGPVLDMLDPREFVVVDQAPEQTEVLICPGCGGKLLLPFDVQKATRKAGEEMKALRDRAFVEAMRPTIKEQAGKIAKIAPESGVGADEIETIIWGAIALAYGIDPELLPGPEADGPIVVPSGEAQGCVAAQ